MLITSLTSLLEVAFRAAVIYIFIVVALRLTGKRQLGQLSPIDLVLLLLLSNSVQNAMVGSDNSLSGGIVAATVLLGLDALLTYARRRSDRLNILIDDAPTLLVYQGKVLPRNMAKEHVRLDDVLQALRENGVAEVSRCQQAILEVDGKISVIVAANDPSPNVPADVQGGEDERYQDD